MLLDNIALFLTIIEKGSLTAAGREMGLSPTTVSERLAALEAHYGVVLLNRTTRAISLTEEGRTLMEGARGLLDSVSELRPASAWAPRPSPAAFALVRRATWAAMPCHVPSPNSSVCTPPSR